MDNATALFARAHDAETAKIRGIATTEEILARELPPIEATTIQISNRNWKSPDNARTVDISVARVRWLER